MATEKMRKLVYWPSDVLKKPSEPVTEAPSKELIQHMTQTMLNHNGAGISAVQVGVHKRIVVVNAPKWTLGGVSGGSSPMVFVNPVIESFGPTKTPMQEGCLSVPGIMEVVPRHTEIVVTFLDEDMALHQSVTFNGVVAHVLQHEIEHLDGKMFLQYTEPKRMSGILGHMMRLRKSGQLRG